MKTLKWDLDNYRSLLQQYIAKQDETALYQAEQFSKLSMQQNISPEEIVNVHIEALKDLYPNLPKEVDASLEFLLEAMISYGLAYQEHQSLREQQLKLKSEISVAAEMQRTLLATECPQIKALDIGAISIAANQMSGDYYHFITDNKGKLGVAIADVIGKGIPAALAMSMIKYSTDSLVDEQHKPSKMLENLNRLVVSNVDAGMFITMFYGYYDTSTEKLLYSTAGHEPGLYYHAETGEFSEVNGKGIVLGVVNETLYRQYELKMKKGDIIILLTDGVTECRINDKFIDRDEVMEILKDYIHLPMQQAVEQVYKHFERLQDYKLRDDFTLIMIKKDV